MAPPKIRQSGNKIVRDDTGAVVWLYGPHLYWQSHRNSGNSTSAAGAEQSAVQHAFRSPGESVDPGWGANLITYFLHTQSAGRIDDTGTLIQSPSTVVDNHISQLVAICNDNNAYLMLVWAFPDPVGTHDRLLDTEGIETLRWAANKVSGENCVIFNVQSEPPSNHDYATMRSRFEAAIDQIRAEYPGALVGFPSDRWSQRGDRWVTHGIIPQRSNIYYCPHIYDGRNSPGVPVRNSTSYTGAVDLQDTFNVPVIIGECGWGGRSNDVDVQELFADVQNRDWGIQAWALHTLSPDSDNTSLIMSSQGPIKDSDGNLTAYGELVRDECRTLFNTGQPGAPSNPVSPPTVLIPSGAIKPVEDGASGWVDGSYSGSTITVTEEAPDWIRVNYTGSPAGFQKKHPSGANAFYNIADYTSFRVIINATNFQLQRLNAQIYELDQSGSPVARVTNILQYEAENYGDDWRRIEIPIADFSFEAFDQQRFNRVELENVSGQSLGEVFVHQWILWRKAQGGSLTITVQPVDVDSDEAIGGPPTVKYLDPNGNAVPGVVINAILRDDAGNPTGDAFTSDSVTSLLTDSDGIAEFENLKIDVSATTDYKLEFEVDT